MARKKKLTSQEAKAQLMADGMTFLEDFHVLGSSAVSALADAAKRAGYRKSKSAPGSTARMFYQYLTRVAPVVRGPGELSAAEHRAYQARARTRQKTSTAHATKKPSPGSTVRLTSNFLRSTGQHTGSAPRDKWVVQSCNCGLCRNGKFIATNERNVDDDDQRHINIANVELVKAPQGKERQHATKKSPAQLQREINEALAKPSAPSTVSPIRTLSPDQLDALRVFADANGRSWKAKLNEAWSTGRYRNYNGADEYGELQQVRNTFGPAWLVKFTFDNPKTHSVKA